MVDWLIYRGVGQPTPDRIGQLPPPPRWRTFQGEPMSVPPPDIDSSTTRRLGGRMPLPIEDEEALKVINAALYLRRPLLVTGNPGTGKSTLAHAVAYELGLGRVLRWPIVSRTNSRAGCTSTTPSAASRTSSSARARPGARGRRPTSAATSGSARSAPHCCPPTRPRVLLIDELDKSDIDLPNDLLNVLEEGEFADPGTGARRRPGE